MKRLLLLVPLLFHSNALASEQPWPDTGSEVYVSASFKGLGPVSVSGASMKYDMPACKQLTVKKADPRKQRWTTTDPVGGNETLAGPWESRMHKSEAECQDHYKAGGEPDVQRSGAVFTIRQPAEKGK